MFDSIQVLLDEHADLQAQLADPAVQANQGKARRVGRRYAELTGIVSAYNKYKGFSDDLEAAREMAAEDPEFAAEVPVLEAELEAAGEKLRRLLIPRDPDDGRNVILEVKAGAGGDKAALFASRTLTSTACSGPFSPIPAPTGTFGTTPRLIADNCLLPSVLVG